MAKTILVGVDDSDTALRAAETAAALAVALGADLHVISAFNVNMAETIQSVQSESQPTSRVNAYRNLVNQLTREAERTALTVTKKLRVKFRELSAVSKALQGAPGDALISESERIDADVIVVGNRRVQGPARILGSVARTVASQSNCDLYVVNTRQE